MKLLTTFLVFWITFAELIENVNIIVKYINYISSFRKIQDIYSIEQIYYIFCLKINFSEIMSKVIQLSLLSKVCFVIFHSRYLIPVNNVLQILARIRLTVARCI